MWEFIAWPLAVVIIAIVFLLLFKGKIGDMLGRVKRISRGGIEAELPEPQKSTERETATTDLLRAFDNIVLREREDNIRQDLTNRGITNPQDIIEILTRHLSVTQIAVHFERIYNFIWGSQIRLLQHLNARATGDTNDNLRAAFYESIPEIIRQGYSFEDYLRFLRVHTLIIQSGDSYQITNLGRSFLSYLIEVGNSLEKAL